MSSDASNSERLTNEKDRKDSPRNARWKWVNVDRVVAIISLVIGVTGIWFALESIQHPNLTYAISADRTAIVQNESNNLSGISVSMNGIPVKSDLSAVQITIWNAGRLPIRHEDIRKPILLICDSGCCFYEITLKTSRDVVSFTNDFSRTTNGICGIDWNLLEQGDGAKIQIIYGGDTKAKFHLEGVVVGQPTIKMLVPSEQKNVSSVAGDLVLYAVGFVVTGLLFLWESARKKHSKPNRLNLTGLGGVMFLCFAMCIADGTALILVKITRHSAPNFEHREVP